MKRQKPIRILLLLAAFIFVPCLQGAAPALRPNIVFVFSDDHSPQTIGAYGGRLSESCRKHQVTPNIDKLAAQGGLFVNGFCGNSLCSPSRASIAWSRTIITNHSCCGK